MICFKPLKETDSLLGKNFDIKLQLSEYMWAKNKCKHKMIKTTPKIINTLIILIYRIDSIKNDWIRQ